MKMDDLKAADERGLRAKLQSFDISVPERNHGRDKGHGEIWVICRLLSTLATAERLAYPLSLHHRERPDFLLTCDGIETGIEITEAVPRTAAHFYAVAKRDFPDCRVLEIPDFIFDGTSLTAKDMRRYLDENRDRLQGSGWQGDEPEMEWANFIRKVIDRKLDRLNKNGFAKYRQNWLAIYDNMELPMVDLQKAVHFLRPLICQTWSKTPCFDEIFIEHSQEIIQITAGGSACMTLEDLWGNYKVGVDNGR